MTIFCMFSSSDPGPNSICSVGLRNSLTRIFGPNLKIPTFVVLAGLLWKVVGQQLQVLSSTSVSECSHIIILSGCETKYMVIKMILDMKEAGCGGLLASRKIALLLLSPAHTDAHGTSDNSALC